MAQDSPKQTALAEGRAIPPGTVPAVAEEPDRFVGWTGAQLRSECEKLGLDSPPDVPRSERIEQLTAQLHRIAAMDEAALLEVLAWSGSTVPPPRPGEGLAARKERLAKCVAQVRTMRFSGLSEAGLKVLAICRGIPVRGDEPGSVIVQYLKAREGLFAKLGRKRRSLLGFVAEKLVGTPEAEPPPEATTTTPERRRLKHEIEDQGLLGGIANRLRRSADGYVQEKLDEIEARIDRKLDEIDARLSDWRDREIANRIRIIKITLWVSVVISALSLVYLYVKSHLFS
jgi:hypothetical protein